MRTTLTLEEDIAAKVQTEMRRTGKSLKVTINELLRLALNTPRNRKPSVPFVIEARPLGLRSRISLDSIGDLLEQIEGPLHK